MTEMTTTAPPKPATPTARPATTQGFTEVAAVPLTLAESVRRESVTSLNQLLADTMTLRDLYKKHHWQASGRMFYPLHLLFDKHAGKQAELADAVAERVMTLGGVCIATAADVAEATLIPRPPRDREGRRAQLARLLHAHEVVLEEARAMAAGRPASATTARMICSSAT